MYTRIGVFSFHSSTKILQILKEYYQEIERTDEALQQQIQLAYDNQNPPVELKSNGRFYHIQEQDYQICAKSYKELMNKIKKFQKELSWHYEGLSIKQQEELKDKFKQYAANIMQIKHSATSSFSGQLTSLTYVYEHPNPDDRRHIEFANEGEMTRKIYGW